MPDEVTGANATAPQSVAQNSSIDLAGFVAMQTAKGQEKSEPKQEAPTEPITEPIEDEVTEEVAETPEEVPSHDTKDVNFDDLTDEEITELASKGKSRLLKRIADLTAKRKIAEARAAELEQERQKLLQGDPLRPQKSNDDNPYKSVKTVEDLSAKAKDVDALIDFARDVLDDNEHAGYDDVIHEENGKGYTKAEVKKMLRLAEKAQKNHIPAQLRAIQEAQQRAAIRKQLQEEAKSNLKWMDGEDNDTRKQFQMLMQGPVVKKILETVPEAEPYMDYLVAHASNSIWGRQEIPIDKPSIKPTPPATRPSSTGADAPPSRKDRVIEELKSSKNLSLADFITLQTAKDKSKAKR